MEQAVEAARAIQREADREAAGEEPNVELLRALETAVAVCYWRPFTQSSIGRLDPVADGPSEESGLGELHRRLRRMRDKVYAHTDEEGGRDVTVRDLGPGTSFITEGWEPLPRDCLPSVIALAEGQADRFRAEALDLGDQLRELGPEDPDEVAQHAAEHKAAGLHRLGWEVGAGATVWARSIQDELARHEAARGDHAANTSDLTTWERMHGSALLLVVAIDQVLAFERRVRKLTGDAELQKARERFDYDGPKRTGPSRPRHPSGRLCGRRRLAADGPKDASGCGRKSPPRPSRPPLGRGRGRDRRPRRRRRLARTGGPRGRSRSKDAPDMAQPGLVEERQGRRVRQARAADRVRARRRERQRRTTEAKPESWEQVAARLEANALDWAALDAELSRELDARLGSG
jgi:hypothetical protein